MQFIFVCVSVVAYMAFMVSLFVRHLLLVHRARGVGVGGVVTWGLMWNGSASQYFETYHIHIPGL